MNTLNAIIFPDITPEAKTILPLVHAFSSVVYCRPVENDVTPETNKQLQEEPSCRIHVPAPLGDDSKRFLQLINDLQHRRDDYAGQLSRLSLAGLPHGKRNDPESKTSIISSLLKSKGIEHKKDESKSLLLWQARLVLKLGEMFDFEQTRLDRELAHIKEMQNELFSELQGEEDIFFPLTDKISQVHGKAEGHQNLRLKAWSRLLFLGEPCNKENLIYITWNKDGFERLADEYDNLKSTLPTRLVTLSLPLAHINKDCSKKSSELLQQITQTIISAAGTNQPEMQALHDIEQQWNSLLEQSYPPAAHSRCNLSLHRFADISARQLFLNSFGSDEDLPTEDLSESQDNVIIGFLE